MPGRLEEPQSVLAARGLSAQQGQGAEGGESMRRALGQQGLAGLGVAAVDEPLQEPVVRRSGLQEDMAGALRPARSPGHLNQQLGEVFARPQIRPVEPLIDVEDNGEGDTREVMPLGNHLGADEEIGTAGGGIGEQGIAAGSGACRVGVDAGQGGRWEPLGQFLLELLGALAEGNEPCRAACRAIPGRRLVMAAVMAA